MTDKEIIDYLRQSNYSNALKGLYKNLEPVKKYVLANSGSTEEAKDIFQDALVILYKKAQEPSFQLQSSLQTYLTGISKNLWLQELRRKNKWSTTELTDLAENEFIDDTEKYSTASAAFNLLGEKCRQLLTLFYFKKQSFKEIAVQLSFGDENTAKNQKYRCLQKAKENYYSLISK